MRVFVTGGTGFVGSHVVDELLERGHEPLCLVRESSDTEHLEERGVDQFVGSLTDIPGMDEALEEVEAVVHIAGVTKVREPRDFYRLNGEATNQLVERAVEVGGDLERFVYVSSIAARGPGFAPEGGEVEAEPVSHYGRSKLLGEKGVQGVADEIPVSIFRPPPVYGPRDEEMFKVFRGAAIGVAPVHGDGSSETSIVHAFDLADAICRSLEEDHPSGEVFGIDDGGHYTWVELTDTLGRAVGGEPMTLCVPEFAFRFAAQANETWARFRDQSVIFNTDKVAEMEQDAWVCGNGPLSEHLGWEPDWPLERGAEQTAEWYRERGWL